MHSREQNIYIGLNIDDVNLISNIKHFNMRLISQGIDPKYFVPLKHIHITLIKIKLQSHILDDRMAAKVMDLIKTVNKKYKTLCIQILNYYYGVKNNSVKLHFTNKTIKFLNDIRNLIINKVKLLTGIEFNDDRDFVPHISILSCKELDLSSYNISIIKNEIIDFNQFILNRKFLIKSINVLTKQDPIFNNRYDELIFKKSKELVVKFY